MATIIQAMSMSKSEPRKGLVLRGKTETTNDSAAQCFIDGKGLMELNTASNSHETNIQIKKVRFDDKLTEHNTYFYHAQHNPRLQRYPKGPTLWRSPHPQRQAGQQDGYLGGKQLGHETHSHSHVDIVVNSGSTSEQPKDQHGKISFRISFNIFMQNNNFSQIVF